MRIPEKMIGGAASALIGAVSWVSITASGPAGGDPVAARLIAALNAHVQERFKDTDKGFGISRMITTEVGGVRRHRLGTMPGSRRPPRFRPENAREAAVLRDLEQAGLGLILYLGSRAGSVKGPVVITDPTSSTDRDRAWDLPDPSALREANRQALDTFARTGSYDFTASDWKFIAIPVRASHACVDCHQLPVGEVVGVAIYGYQEARR